MKRPNGYGCIANLGKNRRRPYAVKVSAVEPNITGGVYKLKREYLGYYETKKEAFDALDKYNKSRIPIDYIGITFAEVWNIWAIRHLDEGSASRKNAYKAAIAKCEPLFDRRMTSLRLMDLQAIIDEHAGASKASLNNIKVVISFVFDWAMKNDIITKDYSKHIEIPQTKTVKNHIPFTHLEFDSLVSSKNRLVIEDIILMYLFTGVRPAELLELKKEDVHIEEQYFHIRKSKTKSGIRIVPIADKVLPLFERMMNLSETDKLLNITYQNYKKAFTEIFEYHTPHDTRSTFISFLAEKDVPQIIIQKIVGHSNGTVTGDVYTRLSLKPLLDAVNKL